MTGRRGPSHSGPYSLACISCFKSKSKCVARPDGEGCQRCHRLKRQCSPSNSLRNRSNEKKQTSAARIAELESKLDGLISQLQPSNIHVSELIDRDVDGITRAPLSQAPLPPPVVTPVSVLELPKLQISNAQDETLLSTFRSSMLPHFPFIHLPAELTAHQLRRDRPYLFQAIACVSTPFVREKVERGGELKKAICNAMLERKTQATADTVDLLLALLAYISWGWDHVLGGNSMLFLISQAKAMAHEIGKHLDGNGSQDMKLMALFLPSFHSSSGKVREETKQEFLEHQRAVLGCFVLSSIYSDSCGLGEPLLWTAQMENRLAAISTETTGCPTDSLLATQVRLQLLTRKGIEVHQQQQLDQGLTVPQTEMATFPALMTLETLQKQLQELKSSLAPGIQQRELIIAHIYSTQLILSETAYKIHCLVPILVSQFARMTATGSMNSTSRPSSRQERSKYLWECVRAAQACTTVLLDSPHSTQSTFRGISFLQWAQLARCVVALKWLTSSMDDEIIWNTDGVRAVIDVHEVLGRAAEKLKLAAKEAGEQEGNGQFGQLAREMRRFCTESDLISNEVNGDQAGRRKGRDSLWFTTVWGVAGGST
ncbi:hypothetical protein N656DRAFT_744575 [Canariomyces notabilis]|uniref:Zn(2)-C6 fungal-type domain-containing protein n=1 Tax=Canariomyces notabilis TaxID=2074819 RepID=A0AAN6YYY7_9PEZI|nr:hypothetical protein N656DRAFT_744575 [Canariomyces arenarius]